MVGIMRSGGAYVPLDPKLPVDRLRYIVEQCGCKGLVSQRKHAGVGASLGIATCVVEELTDAVDGTRFAGVRCDSESSAYVLFTSGSTGKPKGVIVEHGSLTPFVFAAMHSIALQYDDVLLHTCSFTFDPSVELVWCSMCAGSKLVLGKSGALTDTDYLHKLMVASRVTFFDTVPSVLAAYISVQSNPFPPSLRMVYVGGEALAVGLAVDLVASHGSVELWNLYGPTEVTVTSHAFHCKLDSFCRRVPIGCPVVNTTGFVLDTHLASVPVAVAGELYLGGPKVARGYIGRSDLTQQAFVSVSFLPDGAGRLYKTGDRVRWLPDGNLDFLGRVDFQMK